MQIVSLGDNLHEMSNPFSLKKKNIINLLSAEDRTLLKFMLHLHTKLWKKSALS